MYESQAAFRAKVQAALPRFTMKPGLAILTLRVDDRVTGLYVEKSVDLATLGSVVNPEDFLFHGVVRGMMETMLKAYFNRSTNVDQNVR